MAMKSDLKSLMTNAGATWLELPVLHPVDPFLETAGEEIRRRLYIAEGSHGEPLALRPDFTIPTGLYHIARSGSLDPDAPDPDAPDLENPDPETPDPGTPGTDAPARYAYEGLVFRRPEPHQLSPTADGGMSSALGERREAGYEDIGDADLSGADARALAQAAAALLALGEPDLKAQMGDTGLLMAVLTALGLPEPWKRRLRHSFGSTAAIAADLEKLRTPRPEQAGEGDPDLAALGDSGDQDALRAHIADRLSEAGLSQSSGRSASEIVERFLEQKTLRGTHLAEQSMAALDEFFRLQVPLQMAPERLAGFADAHGLNITPAINQFDGRIAAIQSAGIACPITFCAAFGRPLEYYTGMVFQFTRPDGTILCGGGRYDNLLAMLGSQRPVPAVGFSLRLDRIGKPEMRNTGFAP